MAIKDLLVAFDGSESSIGTLKYAVQMAKKYSAALTGIYVHLPFGMEEGVGRWVSQDVLASLRGAHEDRLRKLRESFETLLQEQNFTGEVEWFSEEGYANEVLSEVSRYYDILLIGQYGTDPQKNRRIRAEDLVMVSGKPIIIVPNGYTVRPFQEYAVVAWDGGGRAARALTDAMQILETKRRLDVLSIGSEPAIGGGPGDRNIVRHLKRHGIDARHVVLPAGGRGISATLLDYCRENQPDVLVMGAYGHARIREDLFGGVTRNILRTSTVPMMISH